MADVMLEILDSFSYMSPDIPAFKVYCFYKWLKFWIGVNEYYEDKLKFCSLFQLSITAILILQKLLICCVWLVFSVSYYLNI